MSSFFTIFVLVLLTMGAVVCAYLLLRTLGTMQLRQGDAWPYAQRRFATRGHRGLLRELGEVSREFPAGPSA